VAVNDPNSPATEDVIAAGLRWAVNKYPPDGDTSLDAPRTTTSTSGARAAVNVPSGIKPTAYQRIATEAGGTRGGVVPLTPQTQNLPIYHVGWVRIRGDEAYMTIFRPVTSIGGESTSGAVYQEIRLGLRGGLQPWTVTSVRPWEVGTKPAPESNYYVPEPAPAAGQRSPNAIEAESTYKPGPRAIEAPMKTIKP
jgi:hypothetical protein